MRDARGFAPQVVPEQIVIRGTRLAPALLAAAVLAGSEIDAALATKDADLAQSFVDLSAQRHVALDSGLTDKVNVAVAASARHAAESFALGLVTGEPNDMSSLAGTTLSDLFAFGDIRDAVSEGTRMATGQLADDLVLGPACVGLAITAGTYAALGAVAPLRRRASVWRWRKPRARPVCSAPRWPARSAACCAASWIGASSSRRSPAPRWQSRR